MIWRVILCWLLGAGFACADLSRSAFALTNKSVHGVNAITNAYDANGQLTQRWRPVGGSSFFSYDADGNLTNDGTRSFDYDVEDQLTNVFAATHWRSAFFYDGLGRRRIERDYSWSGNAWTLTNETRYIYDGMEVVQERDGNNNPTVSYTRGLDMSLTLAGAGGIGGLLARTDATSTAYYHTDGSGNVTALMDGSQNAVTRYEYDGFGKLVGKWGTLADANHYRHSSKEVNANSGLYYYGYRFYEPNLQRWMNRDPIGESGGINLYGFVGNNPSTLFDPFGLADYGPANNYRMLTGQTIPASEPSLAESLIPLLGPYLQATYDFENNNYFGGLFNTALASSDAIGGLDGLANALWKTGSHTWDATRKWLTKCGWKTVKGQEVHHWAIPRGGWGDAIPDWLKNQPWNLMPMPNAAFHDALHGGGEYPFNFLERLWYGTPAWLKAGAAFMGGRDMSPFMGGGGLNPNPSSLDPYFPGR